MYVGGGGAEEGRQRDQLVFGEDGIGGIDVQLEREEGKL